MKGNHLTPHPPGSMREVWSISFPLILTAASGSLMHFFDRVFLAQYDLHAMNTAIATYIPVQALQFSTIAVASIAEVFVGRYNGAGKFKQLSWPVWQMIYFSLFTTLIFWGCAFIGLDAFVPAFYREGGASYLFWTLVTGPLFPLAAALACFFIGQGKVWTVTAATFAANFINVILLKIFIFGVPGILLPMGLNGAALATALAIGLECVFLFILFLSKKNRTQYHTGDARFRWNIFKDCLWVGVPSSLGHLVEMIGWSIILYNVAQSSPIHATLYGICQTLWILLFCFIEGVHKGVIALVANALGAKKSQLISKILVSSIKLCALILIGLAGLLWIAPHTLVGFFFNETTSEELVILAVQGMSLLSIGFIFDAFAWIFAGILTAATDTRFVMFTAIWTTWVVAVIPIYFFLTADSNPLLPNWIWIATSLLAAICNGMRYFFSHWKKMIKTEAPSLK